MRTPGKYLEPSDFYNDQLAYDGQVVGTVRLSSHEGHPYAVINGTGHIPNVFAWHSYRGPFTYYEGELLNMLRTENLMYATRRATNINVLWADFTLEDIIHRLQSKWAQFSLVTVDAVNKYLNENFPRKKERYAFLRHYGMTTWCYCKYSNRFIPSRLKVRKYMATFDAFKPCYYTFNVDFVALCAALRPRTMHRYGSSQDTSGLMNYNERATNHLPFLNHPTDDSDIYYGLELEYENRTNDNVRATKELLQSYAILKRDGSVSSGFEICTAPAKFAVHKEKLVEFFKSLPTLNLWSRSNTGMHVHISKEPLSFLQLGKIFALLNTPENEETLVKIAGRQANQYCNATRTAYPVSYPYVSSTGHYSRLNLSNDATIELRMFSTPTTYEDFMHKLEFCKALVDISAPAAVSHSIKEFSDIGLLQKFVSKNHKQYPHLANLVGV